MVGEYDEMWHLLMDGSEEQTLELGSEEFSPRSLPLIDEWLGEWLGAAGACDEEETAKLGFFLARVLIETHGGGLTHIRADGHPLDGEWAVTGFSRGLAKDFHVPFLISASRIGVDRSLTAWEWYEQILREGRPAATGPRREKLTRAKGR